MVAASNFNLGLIRHVFYQIFLATRSVPHDDEKRDNFLLQVNYFDLATIQSSSSDGLVIARHEIHLVL